MFMKRKIKSVKGFTLAELLIVVAIIAVLVAIGIPIFTSQLEKSREAVDLSDVRSAYAEVMMAAITGDTAAIYTKDANQKIYNQAENVYSITVKPLKQKQDGWQTAQPITIGGVSSKAGEPYWKGEPGPSGFCLITYHPPVSGRDEYVSFYWKSGDNGNSGTNENGNNSNGDKDNSNEPSQDGNNSFSTSATEYTKENFYGIQGKIYIYDNQLYVCNNEQIFQASMIENGANPKGWYQAQFTLLKANPTIWTPDKLVLSGDKTKLQIKSVADGDLYFDGKDYYISTLSSAPYDIPNSENMKPKSEGGGWVKIDMNGIAKF